MKSCPTTPKLRCSWFTNNTQFPLCRKQSPGLRISILYLLFSKPYIKWNCYECFPIDPNKIKRHVINIFNSIFDSVETHSSSCKKMSLAHHLRCWFLLFCIHMYRCKKEYPLPTYLNYNIHWWTRTCIHHDVYVGLAHWGRENGRHFAGDTFKCIMLNGNIWIPNKISLKFVPKGPINNIPSLVQIMAWCRPGDKPLSGPMIVS